MPTRTGGSSGSSMHGSPFAHDAAVNAVELARMAGVSAADIHYWSKAGHLRKRAGTSSRFPLTELPKAQLMGIFARQLHMDAANASKLAEQLLPEYAGRPDVVRALRTLAEVVDSRIDGLARLLTDAGLVRKLAEILDSSREEET